MMRILLVLLMALLFPIISLAGWENDGTGTRYVNDDGTYKSGWHQDIDEKWYYLDNNGYMLKNTSTPDGYIVNESGEWINEESVDFGIERYENKMEIEVLACMDYGEQSSLKQFGNALPVTVYYNNLYEHLYINKYRVKFEILKVEVSKDGVLFVKYGSEDDNYYGQLKVTTKYKLEDGSYISKDRCLGSWGAKKEGITTKPVMEYYGLKNKPKPISAEVFIDLLEE